MNSVLLNSMQKLIKFKKKKKERLIVRWIHCVFDKSPDSANFWCNYNKCIYVIICHWKGQPFIYQVSKTIFFLFLFNLGKKLYFFLSYKNRDGDFADFSAFADFFQCFQSSAFLQFRAFRTLIREREKCWKKCLQNNPNGASERNAEKWLTKNIPNRASAPLTSEPWASCAVHTFISLTSGVLNGNILLWRMRFLHQCYFLLDVAR